MTDPERCVLCDEPAVVTVNDARACLDHIDTVMAWALRGLAVLSGREVGPEMAAMFDRIAANLGADARHHLEGP